jgi:hypothetical protein
MTKQPNGQATTPRPSKANTVTYRAIGPVCGGCRHHHRTVEAAQRCADRHHAAIVRRNTAGAYSDRQAARWDGRPLDGEELEARARTRGEGWR